MQRKSSKSYEESLNTDFYKVNITDVAKVELTAGEVILARTDIFIFHIICKRVELHIKF